MTNPTRIDDLRALFDYGTWADERLLPVVYGLTRDEFTRTLGGVQYASVRDVLAHTVIVQWVWLFRCGGIDCGPTLTPADIARPDDLREPQAALAEATRAFLAALTDADLARIIETKNLKGEPRALPLGELLTQAALHGVHHRGQVSLMLQTLGHDPGNFDILLFFAGRRGIPAW